MATESFPWLFSKQEIFNPPSTFEGMSLQEELKNRIYAYNVVQKLANSLTITTQLVQNTAMALLHRFYMRKPFHARFFPFYKMAATCFFLACKVEEQPRRLEDVIKCVLTILNRKEFDDALIVRWKKEITAKEQLILYLGAFDIVIEHPYRAIMAASEKVFGDLDTVEAKRNVVKEAWLSVSTSYQTPVCLAYSPNVIGCALLVLAARNRDFQPDLLKWETPWWEELGTQPGEIQAAMELYLELKSILTRDPTGDEDDDSGLTEARSQALLDEAELGEIDMDVEDDQDLPENL